jgi:ATP-dependent Lon protease
MQRFRLGEFIEEEPYLKAHIELLPETEEKNIETDALARNARDQFQQITQMIPSFPDELVNSITSLEDPLQTAYTIANFQRIDLKDAQEILELDSVYDKAEEIDRLAGARSRSFDRSGRRSRTKRAVRSKKYSVNIFCVSR